jgi:hypothetical protein
MGPGGIAPLRPVPDFAIAAPSWFILRALLPGKSAWRPSRVMGEPDAGAKGCGDLVVAGQRGDGSPSKEGLFFYLNETCLSACRGLQNGGGPLNRLILSDEQWERIAPDLPGKVGDPGRSAADNRMFLGGCSADCAGGPLQLLIHCAAARCAGVNPRSAARCGSRLARRPNAPGP